MISIIAALVIIAAAPAITGSAQAATTTQRYENVIGKGTGTLTCSDGTTYIGAVINFNAIVPVMKPGQQPGQALQGSIMQILSDSRGASAPTDGTIIAGGWMPMERPTSSSSSSYTLSGTTTTDILCGVVGSPFTISGIVGKDGAQVPITLGGEKYAMPATGTVTAQGWHTMD